MRRVYLELPNGNTLTVDDDKIVLDMGGTKVTINNGGDVEESRSPGATRSFDSAGGKLALEGGTGQT